MKTTVAEVKAMSVAQLRKAAPQFGIKKPSQYKRVQLEQMIIDVIVAQASKDKKATKKATSKKSTVEVTKRVKAETVSDEQVQAIADALAQTVIKRKAKPEDLMQANRKVLIAVMKELHCKRWYRTYDKETMVQLILGTAN